MVTAKLFIAYLVHIVSSVFYRETKIVGLVGERRNEAKDNGYHLYRYVRTHHPQDRLYYVIDQKSHQAGRLNNYGPSIMFDSFHHCLLFWRSEVIIQAFEKSCFPSSKLLWWAYRMRILKKKVVFLTHGVTKDYLSHLHFGHRFKFDLFICSAIREQEFVQTAMEYPEEVAKLLGAPRWDALRNEAVGGQIFYMPTWRSWLFGSTATDFESSDFFQNVSSLINSPELIAALDRRDAKLILYLHDVFQESYRSTIKSKSERIVIADPLEWDVQELIKSSDLMITDYSSVAFDFAYLDKPVIYFQFDEERFFSEHFKRGYFSYERDGFGPVFETSEGAIPAVIQILEGRRLPVEYTHRVEKFFGIRGGGNSERVYGAIKDLIS